MYTKTADVIEAVWLSHALHKSFSHRHTHTQTALWYTSLGTYKILLFFIFTIGYHISKTVVPTAQCTVPTPAAVHAYKRHVRSFHASHVSSTTHTSATNMSTLSTTRWSWRSFSSQVNFCGRKKSVLCTWTADNRYCLASRLWSMPSKIFFLIV